MSICSRFGRFHDFTCNEFGRFHGFARDVFASVYDVACNMFTRGSILDEAQSGAEHGHEVYRPGGVGRPAPGSQRRGPMQLCHSPRKMHIHASAFVPLLQT